MNQEKNYILKNPALRPDEDYESLRTRGLQYIQDLSSALWTDYNEHDPGITILEALCYSITELGYRTSLPMEDLLAQTDGTIPSNQTFFTAKNILTQSPLTTDDYRKILIDLPGVQNAWVLHCTKSQALFSPEPPVYLDCKNSALVYTSPQKGDKPICLKGLYNVLLDLEIDPQLGDLNNDSIEIDTYSAAGSTAVSFVVSNWVVADNSLFEIMGITPGMITSVTSSLTSTTLTFTAIINGTTYTISGVLNITNPSGFNIIKFLNEDTTGIATAKQVIVNFVTKSQKTKSIIQSATNTLMSHRNLCEDFIHIAPVQDENIGFCFDVDLEPGTDIDTVLANIYLAIDNYLDPPVNFYLLAEMLGKGYTVDQIFEGPKLRHGFIDTTELEASKLVTTIYASEIIHLIMNIPGVTGVRKFLMSGYNGIIPITGQTGQKWCLTVQNWCKPVLAEALSTINFYKGNLRYDANEVNANLFFEQLLSQQENNKLTSTAADIPMPAGTHFVLDEYTSVQYLFPKVYAIGDNTLPSSETQARHAQARQLKADLLFYDQLLADFLSQLKNAQRLFSTDEITSTYYAQFVNEFKDAAYIYIKDSAGGALFQEQVRSNNNSTVTGPTEWQNLYENDETFVDRRNRFLDHLMARFAESFNDYAFLMYSMDTATRQETEIDPADVITNKIEFLKNYPRMSYSRAKGYNYCPLDNFFFWEGSANSVNLANYIKSAIGPSYTDTAVYILSGCVNSGTGLNYIISAGQIFYNGAAYNVPPTNITLSALSNSLVADVTVGNAYISFADSTISGSPAGLNYTSWIIFSQVDVVSASFWNTNNISGLEERLCLLGGFKDPSVIDPVNYAGVKSYTRRFLRCIGSSEANLRIQVTPAGTGNSYGFTLTSNLPPITLQANGYSSISDLYMDLHTQLKSNDWFNDCEVNNDYVNEGMYLIEHILLRPRNTNFKTATVCVDKDCDSYCDDPYSFRISIVMPYWASHFNNMAFRDYFENLARTEAPAHCMVKVCWINRHAMAKFELLYNIWIIAMANYHANTSNPNLLVFLQDANDNLLNALESLHSEYPVATLHDCADSSPDINPVILGKTILGTINPQTNENQ